MTTYQIKNFTEIDFEQVDPNLDIIIYQDEKYRFGENMCHACWAGGTVLEATPESDRK